MECLVLQPEFRIYPDKRGKLLRIFKKKFHHQICIFVGRERTYWEQNRVWIRKRELEWRLTRRLLQESMLEMLKPNEGYWP